MTISVIKTLIPILKFDFWQCSRPTPPSFPLAPYLDKKECEHSLLLWVGSSSHSRPSHLWEPLVNPTFLTTVKAKVSYPFCYLKLFSDLLDLALPRKPHSVSNKYLNTFMVPVWSYQSWHLSQSLSTTVSLSLQHRYHSDEMLGDHWRIYHEFPSGYFFFRGSSGRRC